MQMFRFIRSPGILELELELGAMEIYSCVNCRQVEILVFIPKVGI
jgi:hypothetical protein